MNQHPYVESKKFNAPLSIYENLSLLKYLKCPLGGVIVPVGNTGLEASISKFALIFGKIKTFEIDLSLFFKYSDLRVG